MTTTAFQLLEQLLRSPASVAVPLSAALRDSDLEVRRSAARALKRLSRGELCPDPERSAREGGQEIDACEEWARQRVGLR